MDSKAALELTVRVGAHDRELGLRKADCDAGCAAVAREDVRELIAAERELGRVGLAAGRAGPPADVAVVQRAARSFVAYVERAHAARDERMAPIRSDHDLRSHLAFPTRFADLEPDDPAILMQHLAHRGGLCHVDGRLRTRDLEEKCVKWRAAHGETEPSGSRVLGCAFLRVVGESVRELAGEARRTEGEHPLENAETFEYGNEPGAAEEVGRDGRARERDALDQQDADAAHAEERCSRRPRDATAHHDRVVRGVVHAAIISRVPRPRDSGPSDAAVQRERGRRCGCTARTTRSVGRRAARVSLRTR